MTTFKIFFSPLNFSHLIKMGLSTVRLLGVLCRIHWTCWICELMSFAKFGEFSVHISTNVSLPHVTYSPAATPVTHNVFLTSSHMFMRLCWFCSFFFSLFFSLDNLYHLCWNSLTFSFHPQSTTEWLKEFFHFTYVHFVHRTAKPNTVVTMCLIKSTQIFLKN